MYRFARGTISSARTFLPSTSGTQPVSSNISEASSTSSATSSLVVRLDHDCCSSDELGRNVASTTLVCPADRWLPTRVATSLYHLVGAGERSMRPSACAVNRFTLDRHFALLQARFSQ